jgi:CRISPR-associated protein Csd2
MSKELRNRYDFMYVFDVKDGNPNGDPDAGNLPRIDAETGCGLVTDVCLKRKIRNYISLIKNNEKPFDIYVKEREVLGRINVAACEARDIKVGEEINEKIPKDLKDDFENASLPEDITIKEEEEKKFIVIDSNVDLKPLKKEIKDSDLSKKAQEFLDNILKNAKARKLTKKETDESRAWICKNFYDVRSFGAVMSFKRAPNCGQVRGPVQFTFARSVDSIRTSENTITRVAVTSEKEADEGKETMFGRKSTVPYGLYVAYGFISANFANQTGFDRDDLELFWEALINMFEHDRSAARGLMSARKLYVFEHSDCIGNAPAYKLFDLIKIEKKEKEKDVPARNFTDYEITIAQIPEELKPKVKLIEKI